MIKEKEIQRYKVCNCKPNIIIIILYKKKNEEIKLKVMEE
jgi:hypothetical protein